MVTKIKVIIMMLLNFEYYNYLHYLYILFYNLK